MITVLAILAISVGIFYTTWMTNWKAVEEHQARADLWHDSNKIMDLLTQDGRFAAQINLQDADKTAVLMDRDGNTLATYYITAAGEMRVIRGASGVSILSYSVDDTQSNFEMSGFSLKLNLFMAEEVLSGLVEIETSAEVYPRN